MYKNNSGVRAINRLNGMYNPHVVAGQRAEDAERHAAWLQTAPGIAWALAEKKRAKANEFIAWSTRAPRRAPRQGVGRRTGPPQGRGQGSQKIIAHPLDCYGKRPARRATF